LPAARKGDLVALFPILAGDENVLIDGKPAARIGDKTTCGTILTASSSFNTNTTSLKIPALELAGATPKKSSHSVLSAESSGTRTLYWLDLKLIAGDTITFNVANLGSYQGSGEAATLDISTNTLHVPYLYLGGSTTYWLDLQLKVGEQIELELGDYGVNQTDSD
jgi:hypothetical protein